MAKILLNDNVTGADVSLEDSLILRAYTADSTTHVEYLRSEDGFRSVVEVSETLANVGGQSNVLISVTEKNSGDTVWVNKNRINDIFELNSEAQLRVDFGGAGKERIKLTDTAATVKAATYTKDGDTVYDVDSFTAGPDVVLLDSSHGDVTANFTAGVIFTVFGEGDSNDSIYSVVSSAFAGGKTEITVNETPTAGATNGGKVWLKA